MTPDFRSEQFRGLSEAEAEARIATDGYNELPSSKPRSLLLIGWEVVKEPMFLLLVASGSLYLILGDTREGMLLLCFVFVIMAIEFYQERKTENALNALKDMASPRALVIRDGIERRIAGREVVKGDIFVLQEGDRVPADAIVLYSVNLLADESLLTGESIPVRKAEWNDSEHRNLRITPGGDDLPVVYSGSMIVQGNGILKVSATGMETELGKIGKSLSEVEEEPTRLKREIGLLVSRLAVIGLSMCALLVLIYTLTREDLLKGFLAGITLAMAMLPEEFPVVLTVFMAIGAWRISKRHVLTRRPAAIETLGSATVLCTDKTGTLTQNCMIISALYNGNEFYHTAKSSVSGVLQKRDCSAPPDISEKKQPGKKFPEPFHEIIEFGVLSSQINPFDPMEKAIKAMETDYLLDTEHIHTDWEMVKEYPLSRSMLAMSRVFTNSDTKKKTIAAKGAPEAIFDLCHLSAEKIEKYAKATAEMAELGLRVLGVAKAEIEGADIPAKNLPADQHAFAFRFVGLIGLSDPVRENVPEAVKECLQAGIKVVMITGDYPVTAENIAEEIGIDNRSKAITGEELQSMTPESLAERIKNSSVFARVIPEQKLAIVGAFKKNGEIVAMTGDGVNDAPALKAADIGIAMGEKGTDVARESSSLVLMDDNFSSIVGAVRMGRRIFDNLQKALGYIFAIHVPIAGLSLIPIFFRDLPLILWPVHIVFLELIIDPACSIVFEAEAEEKNVMTRPPRRIDEPFFGMEKIMMSCTQGLFVLAAVLFVYYAGLQMGYSENEVRALSFTTLIISNISVIFSNRSWSQNIFEILMTPNSTVKWVTGGALFFLILSLNIPILMDLFKFGHINFTESVICTAAGVSTIIWFEIYKCFRLKRRV